MDSRRLITKLVMSEVANACKRHSSSTTAGFGFFKALGEQRHKMMGHELHAADFFWADWGRCAMLCVIQVHRPRYDQRLFAHVCSMMHDPLLTDQPTHVQLIIVTMFRSCPMKISAKR